MKKKEKAANKYYGNSKGEGFVDGKNTYYIEYNRDDEESRNVYQDPLLNSEWESEYIDDLIDDGDYLEVDLPKDWKFYRDPNAKSPLEFESDMGYVVKVTNKFVQIGCQRFDAEKFLELKKNLDLLRKVTAQISLNDNYVASFDLEDELIILNDGEDNVDFGEVDSIAGLIEEYSKSVSKKAVAKKAPAKKAVAKKAPAKKVPAKKTARK